MATMLRNAIRAKMAAGLSLREIARLARVPQSALTVFLQGKDIRLSTAQSLGDYLGIRMTD